MSGEHAFLFSSTRYLPIRLSSMFVFDEPLLSGWKTYVTEASCQFWTRFLSFLKWQKGKNWNRQAGMLCSRESESLSPLCVAQQQYGSRRRGNKWQVSTMAKWSHCAACVAELSCRGACGAAFLQWFNFLTLLRRSLAAPLWLEPTRPDRELTELRERSTTSKCFLAHEIASQDDLKIGKLLSGLDPT